MIDSPVSRLAQFALQRYAKLQAVNEACLLSLLEYASQTTGPNRDGRTHQKQLAGQDSGAKSTEEILATMLRYPGWIEISNFYISDLAGMYGVLMAYGWTLSSVPSKPSLFREAMMNLLNRAWISGIPIEDIAPYLLFPRVGSPPPFSLPLSPTLYHNMVQVLRRKMLPSPLLLPLFLPLPLRYLLWHSLFMKWQDCLLSLVPLNVHVRVSSYIVLSLYLYYVNRPLRGKDRTTTVVDGLKSPPFSDHLTIFFFLTVCPMAETQYGFFEATVAKKDDIGQLPKEKLRSILCKELYLASAGFNVVSILSTSPGDLLDTATYEAFVKEVKDQHEKKIVVPDEPLEIAKEFSHGSMHRVIRHYVRSLRLTTPSAQWRFLCACKLS